MCQGQSKSREGGEEKKNGRLVGAAGKMVQPSTGKLDQTWLAEKERVASVPQR